MALKGRISSNVDDLDQLHAVYKWLPNGVSQRNRYYDIVFILFFSTV